MPRRRVFASNLVCCFFFCFYPSSDFGCRFSGVGVDCRLYLSVEAVRVCRLSCADCRLSVIAVGGCCWFLVVGCWLLIVLCCLSLGFSFIAAHLWLERCPDLVYIRHFFLYLSICDLLRVVFGLLEFHSALILSQHPLFAVVIFDYIPPFPQAGVGNSIPNTHRGERLR